MRKAVLLLACAMITGAVCGCGQSGGGEAPAPIEEEQPLSIEEQLELGNGYLVDLDYDEAIVVFTGIVDVEPRNIEAWSGLATAYTHTGNFAGAAEAYAHILDEKPDDRGIHYRHGIVSVLADNTDDGGKSLERGLELGADENGVVSDEAFEELMDAFEELGVQVSSEEDSEYYTVYALEFPDGRHVLLIRYADGTVEVRILEADEEVPAQLIPDTLTYFKWRSVDLGYDSGLDYVIFSADGTATFYFDSGAETMPIFVSGGDGFYPAGTIYVGSADMMSPEAQFAIYKDEYEGIHGLGMSGIHFADYYFLEPVRQ